MFENICVFTQSSIKFSGDKNVYFDPFSLNEEFYDADYIFITHSHYDHFSIEDINKVRKNGTKYIIPESMRDEVLKLGFNASDILFVEPGMDYVLDDLEFTTVPSYNLTKSFHKKEFGWVGYLIRIGDYSYYIPGDIDAIEEAKSISCDVCFLPIGGTYTMTYEEAALLVNSMDVKGVVPIHYGSIVGEEWYGDEFSKLVSDNKKCKILLKFD